MSGGVQPFAFPSSWLWLGYLPPLASPGSVWGGTGGPAWSQAGHSLSWGSEVACTKCTAIEVAEPGYMPFIFAGKETEACMARHWIAETESRFLTLHPVFHLMLPPGLKARNTAPRKAALDSGIAVTAPHPQAPVSGPWSAVCREGLMATKPPGTSDGGGD